MKKLINEIKAKKIFIIFLAVSILTGIFLVKEIKKSENYFSYLENSNFSENFFFARKEIPFLIPLWEDLKRNIISHGVDFMEVNLEDKKTRLYEKGELTEELTIQAIGNPLNWGGSPVGIYKAMAKYNSAFSNSVQAHMPFAIQYYGKYFIHGEPYFSGGTKIVSSYSGGCIRHSDRDAKKIFDFVNDETLILIIDKKRDNFEYPGIEDKSIPEVSAKSFLVADLDSGTVLLEKNSNQKLPIASITKLMTAIVVSENFGLNRNIIARKEMMEYYDSYGETPEIEVNNRYQLIELLYPLLVRSSNQSAEILSRFMGKKETVEAMNEKARSIKMNRTFFSDTSGLSENNVSTANDLFYLARYLFNNFGPILSITKSERVPKIQILRFNLSELENRNIFIYDSSFIGGKTGFTNASKNTALFIFRLSHKEGDRNIVINLIESSGLKRDTQIIYGWLLKNYFFEIEN